jgi:hypothetical protein
LQTLRSKAALAFDRCLHASRSTEQCRSSAISESVTLPTAALVERFELRLKQVNPQLAALQYDVSDLVGYRRAEKLRRASCLQ